MNKHHKRLVRFAFSAGLACAGNFLVPASYALASTDVTQPWPELDTVKALLQADAAAASGGCNWDPACISPASNGAKTTKPKPADNINVDAIYGFGKQLRVELSVNGKRARYLAGRSLPEFGPGAADGAYSLLAIEGSCVRLRRAERVRTVCLGASRP